MKIPEEEVQFAMRQGVIDLLTVIPVHLLPKALAFVRIMIADYIVDLYSKAPIFGDESRKKIDKSQQRWDKFWEGYFEK